MSDSILTTGGVLLRGSVLALVAFFMLKFVTWVIKLVNTFHFFNNLPGEKSFSFIFGNLHKIPTTGEARLDYSKRFMNDLKLKYARFWMGPVQPVINLYHPEVAKQVLRSSVSAPKSRGFGTIYEFLFPWIGEGLIVSNGHTWARSRRLLTHAFHFDILKPYMGIYNQAADILIEKLDVLAESGEKFDVCPLMTLCTLDVILKCAMSHDIDVQRKDHDPYAQATRDITSLVMKRTRNPLIYFDFIYRLTAEGRKFYRHCDYVHKVAEDIIAKRRKSLEQDGPPKNRHLDFLDILLTARDEDGQPMTDLEIRNEVDTFMFAGHDTTATGAPWILYCLAKYPDYQKQVQNELDGILAGRNSDAIEWNDLALLQTLALCIKETFRLYPPVPFIQRNLSEDLHVDGKCIPAGTAVTIPIVHIHRNADVWDSPDEFKPERFTPENSKSRDNFAYVPFSAGSRNCIGQNFALYEEKVLIARILSRYTVEIAEDGPKAERLTSVVLSAHNGLWFRLKKRH